MKLGLSEKIRSLGLITIMCYWLINITSSYAQVNQYYSHHENWHSYGGCTTLQCNWEEKVWFGSDTVIGSTTMYKGYVYSYSMCYFYGSLTEPMLLARDSANISYIYPLDSIAHQIVDTIIIDFGRTDSLFNDNQAFWSFNPIIGDIDTIELSGLQRKIFRNPTSSGTDGIALEGVFHSPFHGYPYAPFTTGAYGISCYSHLDCYGVEDSSLYLSFGNIYSRDTGTCNRPYMNMNIIGDEEIRIYPNPVEDIIFITGILPEVFTVNIFDVRGKLVGSYINANELNLSSLSPGIYNILLHWDKGNVSTRIIKLNISN